MTEDRTAETNGSRSFEERVFARFDAMDERFDRVEIRLGSVEDRLIILEARQYDTKPIWERALAAIGEITTEMRAGFADLRAETNAKIETTNTEMRAGFGLFQTQIEATNTEMRAAFGLFQTQIEATNAEMRAGFDQLRTELDFGLRRVERKIDALNHNILELHADHRYVDSRLEKVEAQLKPS